jgi:MYXO-CTERM domain-containing protein
VKEERREIMKKFSIVLALSLGLVFGLTLQAAAFTFWYAGTDPNYNVNNIYRGNHIVYEDYNPQSLIPFSSQGGYAVVDLDKFRNPIWFDGYIQLITTTDLDNLYLKLIIKNTSPYTWSDYHIIFGTNPSIPIITPPNNAWSVDFGGVTIIQDTEINYFYSGAGSRYIYPGEELSVEFVLNTSLMSVNDIITFRQIATTATPIPSALPLFGTGLLGLGLLGWRRRRN